jgi:hypothetical protein
VESQDNALTPAKAPKLKTRGLATGSWWRFSRYEIRDGYIKPAPEARLHRYDPWQLWARTRPVGRRSDNGDPGPTPYRALLEMLKALRYRDGGDGLPDFTPAQADMLAGALTEQSEQKILEWCARFGLLGILPHRVPQVALPPRNDIQLEYVRMGIGWKVVERERGNPSLPIIAPCAVVQPLGGLGLAIEPVATTWARFFPGVSMASHDRFSYPQPLTDSFWEMYAEPLGDFLSGARALQQVLSSMKVRGSRKLRALHGLAMGGLPQLINALVAPTGLATPLHKSGLGLNWVGGSLLASLTLMLLEDLSLGRALQCPCGQLFVSSAYQARYCSRRCRWRFEQRSFRKGNPA